MWSTNNASDFMPIIYMYTEQIIITTIYGSFMHAGIPFAVLINRDCITPPSLLEIKTPPS